MADGEGNASRNDHSAVGDVAAECSSATPSSLPPSGAAGLAVLPHELVLHIIGLAAYPLSAWVALDAAATEGAMREAGVA